MSLLSRILISSTLKCCVRDPDTPPPLPPSEGSNPAVFGSCTPHLQQEVMRGTVALFSSNKLPVETNTKTTQAEGNKHTSFRCFLLMVDGKAVGNSQKYPEFNIDDVFKKQC